MMPLFARMFNVGVLTLSASAFVDIAIGGIPEPFNTEKAATLPMPAEEAAAPEEAPSAEAPSEEARAAEAPAQQATAEEAKA